MKTIRVFPRKTNQTPTDENAFIGDPLRLLDLEADRIHISVAFTWDMPEAERLSKEWRLIAPVEIGGPATGMRGEEFTPGMYLKKGHVITSRGCNNKCWFCSVWKRDGTIRELPITEGNVIQDDNLLACSREHIEAAFAMLKKQPYGRPEFAGGIEAAILKEWHVEKIQEANTRRLYCAYDTPEDLEPLREAGKLFRRYDIDIHTTMAYVLIGYPGDTIEKAGQRIEETIAAGFMPMAMLYRDSNGDAPPRWKAYQRTWARPAMVGSKINARKDGIR